MCTFFFHSLAKGFSPCKTTIHKSMTCYDTTRVLVCLPAFSDMDPRHTEEMNGRLLPPQPLNVVRLIDRHAWARHDLHVPLNRICHLIILTACFSLCMGVGRTFQRSIVTSETSSFTLQEWPPFLVEGEGHKL
jgi:hypothetical protein